jgi:primosomal protein N'
VIAKINNRYRWHLIIKSPKTHDPSGSILRSAVRNTLIANDKRMKRSVKLVVDIDPVGLM